MQHPIDYATVTTAQQSTASLLPTSAETNSTILLWKYLGTVGSWTFLVIALLLWMYWQLKKNPTFLNRLKSLLGAPVSVAAAVEDSRSLVVEETIQLDADKLLHLVRCEGEKFLMSNGPDGLKLLTKVTSWQEALYHVQQQEPLPNATAVVSSTSTATERTQAVVDTHGDVHFSNSQQHDGTSSGVSMPTAFPKTILGKAVPWFTHR
jgi:hypothetical protein